VKWIGRADPLLLFLVAGLALYLLIEALGLARGDERLITVDEATLNTYLASEGGRLPGRSVEAMSPDERRTLIERYVSEEALYREARALGLDRGDMAIRRRLVQSLRFSLQGNAQANDAEPTDAELRSFLASHRERYVEDAKVSFSHVFFDSKRRGKQLAFEAARQTLPAVGRNDWLAMGDRYPYQRSQIDVTKDALSSELGQAATRRILALAPGESWQGPVESELGFHLVRIDRKTSGSEPAFEAIRGDLAAGLAEERREKALQRAIDGIVAGYRVRLSPGLEGAAK
jgi:hypothetical protein